MDGRIPEVSQMIAKLFNPDDFLTLDQIWERIQKIDSTITLNDVFHAMTRLIRIRGLDDTIDAKFNRGFRLLFDPEIHSENPNEVFLGFSEDLPPICNPSDFDGVVLKSPDSEDPKLKQLREGIKAINQAEWWELDY